MSLRLAASVLGLDDAIEDSFAGDGDSPRFFEYSLGSGEGLCKEGVAPYDLVPIPYEASDAVGRFAFSIGFFYSNTLSRILTAYGQMLIFFFANALFLVRPVLSSCNDTQPFRHCFVNGMLGSAFGSSSVNRGL